MVVTSYTGEMYLCTSQDIHFFDLLFYKHATVYLCFGFTTTLAVQILKNFSRFY